VGCGCCEEVSDSVSEEDEEEEGPSEFQGVIV